MKHSAPSFAAALIVAASLGLLPARGQSSADAWSRFAARTGPGLELVRADGGALEVAGSARAAGPLHDAAAAVRATLEVLSAAEDLLGVPAAQFARTNHSQVAGVHVVQLEQRVHDVPVRGSFVELRWSDEGNLLALRAVGLSRSIAHGDFVVVREDAAELARLAIPDVDSRWLWADSPTRELLVVGEDLRPAWNVFVWNPTRPDGEWAVTIDGIDGTVRDVRSTVVEGLAGSVDGRGAATGGLNSGPPAVLPMGNIQVSAIDRGVGHVRITTNSCGDTQVTMSSDGARVAWISSCDGDRELWTAASDGSGALKLTTNTVDDHSPAISADGSRIVFVSNAGGDEEIWTILSSGTGLTQLTFNTAADHSPSITGDGTRVAYISQVDGDPELATLLVASPSPVQLTFDSTADASPRIAAGGSRIVWVSWSDGDADVCTITPAGTGFARVTLNSVEDGEPDILADGSRVVFASSLEPEVIAPSDPSAISLNGGGGVGTSSGAELGRVGRRLVPPRDVFEALSDGTSLTRLTDGEADERSPSYATAGGCVAYVTDEDGDAEIDLLDIAGGSVMRLTDNSTKDDAPRASSTCGRGAWVANDGDGEIFAWNLMLPGASALGFANAAGAYTFPWADSASPSVSTRLRGKYVRVSDLDPRWSNARANAGATTPTTTANLHLNPSGAIEGPTAQVTAYYHANRAHDALATILTRPPLSIPVPLPIDAPLKVRANFPEVVANAFYSSMNREATFFIGGGPTRPNTACDTFLLHEYGHYFDDMHGGLSAGSACEAPYALSEGIGDTVAMFVTAQQLIGEDFYGTGTWVRDYTRPYWLGTGATGAQQYGCDTCPPSGGAPEVHEHGAAFAGFAWDLRASIGAITAENLIFGALSMNPPDMQSAVSMVFSLAATPAFGGTGDPLLSPLNGVICAAAARHGFDCMTRPDQGSHGCSVSVPVCTAPAMHRTIGTEWLGALIDGELSCEIPVNPDDDGLTLPSPVMSGETKTFTITLKVNPAMKFSGRYGAPLPHTQLASRRVFLNAWMFVDDGTMAGFTVHKVLGTGSSSPTSGPDNIGGGNTLAFNPDTWAGSSLAFACDIVMPTVPTPRFTILRVRLDYGEDAGFHESCLSHASLSGPCGIARYGEVEDFQTVIMPP